MKTIITIIALALSTSAAAQSMPLPPWAGPMAVPSGPAVFRVLQLDFNILNYYTVAGPQVGWLRLTIGGTPVLIPVHALPVVPEYDENRAAVPESRP